VEPTAHDRKPKTAITTAQTNAIHAIGGKILSVQRVLPYTIQRTVNATPAAQKPYVIRSSIRDSDVGSPDTRIRPVIATRLITKKQSQSNHAHPPSATYLANHPIHHTATNATHPIMM